MNQMCRWVQRYAPLLGRILIAQLFIIAGYGKAAAFPRTAAFMANHGLPMPEVLLVLTIAVELGGGILLIAGWKARYIAIALFIFTLLASVVFHPFWSVETQELKQAINDFMKNLAIMGGLLYVVTYGSVPLSIGSEQCEPTDSNATRRKKTK